MKSTLFSLLFLSQRAFSSGGLGEGTMYDHMDAWSGINSMCGALDESPIDIKTSSVVHDSNICVAAFEWDILNASVTTFKVNNNGHSIGLTPAEVVVDPDMDDIDGYLSDDVDGTTTYYDTLTLSDEVIATFQNYFLPQGSEHDEWCFHSLHFHWGTYSGTGSEHLVDGVQYPLEVHFVHYSCAHASLGTTLGQFPYAQNVTNMEEAGEDQHQLAVVGFFFEISEENNPAFDILLNDSIVTGLHLPESAEDYEMIKGFDLSDIIPEDYATSGYYAYEGSLTTPPCTNIVRWHVMNAKGSISESQMELFRTFMSTAQYPIAPNFREVQENPNTVYACFEESDNSTEQDSTAVAVVWVYAVITIIMPIVLFFVCYWQSKKEKVLSHHDENDKKPAQGAHH